CFGTNGLTNELLEIIKQLIELEEIIFCFDMDEAGQKATLKYAKLLQSIHPKVVFYSVQFIDKDVNETLVAYDETTVLDCLEKRKPIDFSSSTPSFSIEKETPPTPLEQPKMTTDLFFQLNDLIEKSGIVGEQDSRLLLFIIASSYKTKHPLHAIVQGSSGSGKTHLISKIADLMPQEDVLRFTRITESSLYNWGEYELVGKLLIIEDLDGLKEEAMFAMRELISNQRLSSSVSIKDKKGNIKAVKKEVRGVFSSLSATTKGEIYEDNMSRSFLLAVDESSEQSRRIIAYQN
ncbi:toprim domain-containing protein, partial [Empedobacter sp. GD03861]|uniref:toprim domain-containing protein n=1 Tax=Empedobacter sp. GD03861 TaxID=2975390 RepID=UPI00244A8786